MNGMDETHFAPEGYRGMLVTALYRLAGSRRAGATFHRCGSGAGTTRTRRGLGGGSGHCQGITATAFQPREPSPASRQPPSCTGMSPSTWRRSCRGADLTALYTRQQSAGYAKTAMSWAVAEGFFEGYGDGTLRPFTAL